MKVLRKILIALLLSLLSLFLAFFAYFLIVTKDATLQKEKLLLPNAQVFIYDKSNARVNYNSSFATRDIIAIDRLPKHVKDAFLCTEDKRFYSHHGFDYLRIGKAILNNLRSASFREGASTISQQLIKNTHLTLEKTLRRKLKEVKLTASLERTYSKDEILEMYLNTIYFGHSCYGIAAASEFYFQKPAEELTLDEAAVLAGLVRSPNHYSPFKNSEQCKKRRNIVLALMRNQGVIAREEFEKATAAPLSEARQTRGNHFAYTQCVIDELETLSKEYSFPLNETIEIYTQFDKDTQATLESLSSGVSSDKTFAVIDNQTHTYSAYHSSVGRIRRSPGSLIKPLLVYAPAIEQGILSPATPILDEKINISGYAPQNYGGEFHGYVSAREALAKSYNIPAVKTLNTLGVEAAAAIAKKLRLPLQEHDKTLAIALGGMREGLTFQEILSAYTVFASDGQFTPTTFIRQVKVNGKTAYEKPSERSYAFSPETAYLVTDMLKTAAKDGTAKRLRSLPFPVAAKTGTVGTKNGNLDAYTIAYTPSETVGVWLGNRDNKAIEETGGGLPAEIAKNILECVHGSHECESYAEDFDRPIEITTVEIDRVSYENSHKILLADKAADAKYKKAELFNRRFAPKEQSTIFSNPTLKSPTLEYRDGCVTICFSSPPYDFYRYKIERIEGTKCETIYDGKALKEFVDDSIKNEKRYAYQITPYYQENLGVSLTTPTIFTKAPPPILDKPWWDY